LEGDGLILSGIGRIKKRVSRLYGYFLPMFRVCLGGRTARELLIYFERDMGWTGWKIVYSLFGGGSKHDVDALGDWE